MTVLSAPPRPRAAAFARVRHALGAYAGDALGALFALLYGLAALSYPPAADQSLFAYVGQLWRDGGLPYRDAVDNKPPGIFAVYALAAWVSRQPARVVLGLELLGVLCVGAIVARVVREPEAPRRDGLVGLGCATASVVYYSCFDYWSLGQVEFWQGLFALAAVLVALRGPHGARGTALAGALAGLSTVFKPMPLAALAGAIVSARALRLAPARGRRALHATRALSIFALAAVASVGFALLPIVSRAGGLGALRECVVEFNGVYARAWTARFHLNWARVGPCVIAVYALVLPALGIAAARTRPRTGLRTGLLALGSLALAVLGVAIQRKYFDYHWVAAWPSLALLAVWAIDVLATRLRVATALVALSAALFLAGGAMDGDAAYHTHYGRHVLASWQFARGRLSREGFLAPFGGPFGNDYPLLARAGELIARRAWRGDTLCVRGYTPAAYLVAGLRCPSRLPWEQHVGTQWQPPVTEFAPGDVRARWVREHRAALVQRPPTFVLGFAGWPADLAALRARGYRAVGEIGSRVVMERR